ncbi:unnamed protein product, partial [Closterium sp. NIES-54]
VAASSQVFATASGSGPESAPCSCRLLSHQNLLWHHRLGHPSLPRLRGMASRVLGHEHHFLLVVDDYSRYTTDFPLRSKGDVTEPFAVQYAAHQLNLQPRVSLPETSPTLRWTGKVGDASAFRVWGSQAFVCDLSADKLSPRAVPCDVTFDESVPYYRLFPYRTAPLPPPPLFLAPGPPPVDPLPPQGPAPSGVSQVDAVEPVKVVVDSGAARGAEPVDAGSAGAESGGAKPGGAESRGAEPVGVESGGAEPGGAEPGGAESARVASCSASCAARAGGPPIAPGPGGARTDGTGAVRTGGTAAATGVGPPGASGAAGAGATGCVGAGVRAAGASGVAGAGATGGVGAGVGAATASGATGAGATGGVGTGVGPAGGSAGAAGGTGAAGLAGVGAVGPGGAAGTGAVTGGTVPVPVGTGSPARPRPYFVPLLEQVLGLPPSPGPTPPLEYPQPVQSQSPLQPVSPLPAPSPYAGPTGGLAERQSSLPVVADPESDSLRAASPSVARLLSTVVTDPSFESTAASALVAELVDFAARCRLDYTASLEEFQCFAAALPHLVSTLLALEGDPDAPDIPTPRSYAEAIEGPYSSQWQSAMDAEMASWKSTGTYVDQVPPPGANIVSGMWIFRVKRPPGSPPVFKARYVARGFSQRQGVDYFQTFSPTLKMNTLRVLPHVAAQLDYELHSLYFSTAFLQGSLHEEIWLRRPPGFTGSFPP